MAASVVPGMLAAIKAKERLSEPTCLQMHSIEKTKKGKFCCVWSDGSATLRGIVGSEMTELMEAGGIEEGGIIRATQYVCDDVPDKGQTLCVHRFEVVSKYEQRLEAKAEPLSVKMEGGAENGDALQRAPSVMTPRHAKENTGPYKTPAAKVAERHSGTPGFTPPSTGRKALQPILALNPYNNNWTIKARVSSKTPLRNNSKTAQPYNLFSITLVDEQGTEIEATLWRDMADQWYEKIQEGKVYYFTKGRVKPANRAYATTRNDYSIDFQNETLIEECADVDPSKMQAKLCFVRFDALAQHIGQKGLVDVIGIVKETHALGSVKRKSDGTDLPRRDLSLVDDSGKMVRLTIWGALAEAQGAALESLVHPVVSVAAAKVGDYDGVSLSTVSRSTIQINPESKEVDELRTWWESQGSSSEFTHAGEGLAPGRRSGEGGANERGWIAQVLKEQMELPPPDAKAEFCTVRASIMQIDVDQSPLFYTADAATGKKVLAGGDAWRFAVDGKPCTAMERRYFLRILLMDPSGECDVMLSNDQAEKLLGRKADEMFQLKEAGSPEFQAVLSAPKFTDWTVTIKSNTSEYKGELKQRLQGYCKFSEQDFVAESKWLLSNIQGLKAPA